MVGKEDGKVQNMKLRGTFSRFVLVGIINTLVGAGVMFFAYNVCHVSYWGSSALNYIVGSILSYFLNKYYTFQSKRRSGAELLRFVMVILAAYAMAYGLARPLVKALLAASSAWQDNLAMVAGMIGFVGLNYLGQKYWVFRQNRE